WAAFGRRGQAALAVIHSRRWQRAPVSTSATFEWDPSHAMLRVLDHDDGALLERVGGLSENIAESVDYALRPCVVQSEHDHARSALASRGYDLSEIEIK